MKRPFHAERDSNAEFNQIVAENEALFVSVEEWIMEGWGCDHLTAETAAAALFMEANTQDESVRNNESHVGYPAFLRKLAFKCLNAAGHTPGPVVLNVFGGIVQGCFADYAVSVVVVDWDQESANDGDYERDPTLFKWDGKYGSACETSCMPLGQLEPETWFAVAHALKNGEGKLGNADEAINKIMVATGQTY